MCVISDFISKIVMAYHFGKFKIRRTLDAADRAPASWVRGFPFFVETRTARL